MAEVFDFLQRCLRDDMTELDQSSPFLSTQLTPKDFSSVSAAMRALISGFVEQKDVVSIVANTSRRFSGQFPSCNIIG